MVQRETFISKDALSIPKWPGWGSLVILWDCGSLDPSSNLGPGPFHFYDLDIAYEHRQTLADMKPGTNVIICTFVTTT